MQLFSMRATDIDDLLMNTWGTWVGYLLFRGVLRIVPGICERFGAGENPGLDGFFCEGDKPSGKEAAVRTESPVCRLEMELCFGIVLLLMLTLQPLIAEALWEILYR